MRTLRALLLSDGRPGHYTLSEGILAAIARLKPVETVRLEARRPRWLPAGALSFLSNRGVPPARILTAIYGLSPARLPRADLVVSAGGDTLAANIAAARLLGVPNLFYGSLRRYPPEAFALVLTSYARHAQSPRHLVTLKPSRLDPDAAENGSSCAPPKAGTPPKVAGLIVGGNAGTIHYAPSDWDRLFQFVRAQSSAHGTRWVAATSPRTPDAQADALAHLSQEPSSPLVRLIDYRSAGPGTLGPLFRDAAAIVVTSDSSSMLSEAIWMRRPVLSVSPERADLPADELDYRRFLETSGWCAAMPIRELTPARFLQRLAAIKPLELNPLDDLAEKLARRLPGLLGKP